MKSYEVLKDGDRYTIGEKIDGMLIINDGICGYYWWDTKEAAQKAADAYNAYEGSEWLGQHGYGNDTINADELWDTDAEMVELYRLFNAIEDSETTYTLWDRTTDQHRGFSEGAALEICQSADTHTGPWGYWGHNVDLVLISETGDDDPVIEAIRHRGEWVTIPADQGAHIDHELSQHGYDPDPAE